MKLIKIAVIPLIILVTCYFIMHLLLSSKTEPTPKPPTSRKLLVETVNVSLGRLESTIKAYGRIRSAQPIQLITEVSGGIQKGTVPFQPGQSFAKGSLLLRIDDRQARLRIKSTKSDMLNALATVLPEIKLDFPTEYKIWETYFNACEFDNELPPLPEISNQKIKLYLSRFNVFKLYFSIKDQEINLSKHYFYAPFSGSILSTETRAGATARSGAVLGQIINLDHLEVEVPIQAEDLQWIDKKGKVTFTSSELAGTWHGSIARIGSSIDSATQTVSVYIVLETDQKADLFEGAFLEAEIPGSEILDAFRLPREAIYDENHVYLVEEGKLAEREVAITRKDHDSVVINKGLSNGDMVVVEILQGVAAGMQAESRTEIQHDSDV